jgi:hypothetical protein
VSRDSSLSIATGCGLDDRGVGVRVPVWSRIVSSPNRADRLWGPPNLLSNGYQGFSTLGKRPGREADHSPPASAEVKKMWIHGGDMMLRDVVDFQRTTRRYIPEDSNLHEGCCFWDVTQCILVENYLRV